MVFIYLCRKTDYKVLPNQTYLEVKTDLQLNN